MDTGVTCFDLVGQVQKLGNGSLVIDGQWKTEKWHPSATFTWHTCSPFHSDESGIFASSLCFSGEFHDGVNTVKETDVQLQFVKRSNTHFRHRTESSDQSCFASSSSSASSSSTLSSIPTTSDAVPGESGGSHTDSDPSCDQSTLHLDQLETGPLSYIKRDSYHVTGQGRNLLGVFTVEGTVTVSGDGPSYFTARKIYSSEQLRFPSEQQQEQYTMDNFFIRLNFANDSFSSELERKRPRPDAESDEENSQEARRKAQQWRKQEFVRGFRHTRCPMKLPYPKILKISRAESGFFVTWEVILVPTGPYQVIKELKACMQISGEDGMIETDVESFSARNNFRERITQHISSIPTGTVSIILKVSASDEELHVEPVESEPLFIRNFPHRDEVPLRMDALWYSLPVEGSTTDVHQSFAVLSWQPCSSSGVWLHFDASVKQNNTDEVRSLTAEWVDGEARTHIITGFSDESTELNLTAHGFVYDQFGWGTGQTISAPRLCRESISSGECTICKESLSVNSFQTDESVSLTCDMIPDETIVVPSCCSHIYHAGCLSNWARRESTCPLCCRRFRSLRIISTSSCHQVVKLERRNRRRR